MKKITTFFCAILLASSFVSASGYWARSFVTVTSNETLYNYAIATDLTWTCDNNWASNTAFESYDFGTSSSLVLNGGYGESGTYGADDFIDASSFVLYYRAYSTTGTAGNWSNIALNNSFFSNGDRLTSTRTLNSIYNNVSAGIDVHSLVGNTPGTYYLEVILAKTQYWQTTASTWITANGDQDNAFALGTSSTGYKAGFTISSGTGIDQQTASSLKLSVMPGLINAQFKGKAQVELYTMTGLLIRSTVVENQFTQIIKSGAYLIRVNGQTNKILVP
ncbi:MAG: hypothetical protein PHS59_14000 [Paludibacter sp.]|nr:hypothetical protein [Paludibacter sp.]